MTQPSYVPIVEADQVRGAYRLRTPDDWHQDRVAELRNPEHPHGPGLGVPGPDQGYGLLIAKELFEKRLELTPGITAEDALAGAAAVGSARAALFGRAPVGKDIELALVLFGFLGDAPQDLLSWRSPLFQAAAHHYEQQRHIVAAVPESTLRLAPDAVRGRLGQWRSLLETDVPATDTATDAPAPRATDASASAPDSTDASAPDSTG